MLDEFRVTVQTTTGVLSFFALGFDADAVKQSAQAKHPTADVSVAIFNEESALEKASAKLFANPIMARKWIDAKRYVLQRGLQPYRHLRIAGRIVSHTAH